MTHYIRYVRSLTPRQYQGLNWTASDALCSSGPWAAGQALYGNLRVGHHCSSSYPEGYVSSYSIAPFARVFTHWGRNKMSDMQTTLFFTWILSLKCIFVQMSLKFVTISPIGNKSTAIQVMAWRLTGHCLNQWWHISFSLYDVTWSEWFKPRGFVGHFEKNVAWCTETNLRSCRRYFQRHYLESKCTYFDSNISEICSPGSN